MSRTEAQNRATYKYAKAHLKRVPLDLQLSDYEELKQAATAAGMSVNGFIKHTLRAAGAISGQGDSAGISTPPAGGSASAGEGG